MDESFAPEGLLDKQRLKALCARSDGRGLAQLAGHGAALLATTVFVAQSLGGWLLVPALLAQGVVLSFLFAPLHEAIHRTAFRSRRLNDAVAWVCGAVLLLPPEYFRAFHFAHHRYTQDPARDPELARPKPATLGAYLLQVSGLPYWRERVATLLRHAASRIDEAFIPARQRPAIVREARLLLGFYGAIAGISVWAGNPAALYFWVLPALLGQPVLRLFLLAEHGGCPQVPEMLRNSRTTRSNALVRRLAWNMPYHAEHHVYPALPFHALPAAHTLLKDRIAVTAPSYIVVHRELLAALRRARGAAPASV